MMSLLNDMLRDLTHQQKATDVPGSTQQAELDFNAQEQRELFYHTRAAKPLPRTLLPSLAIFIVVLALFSLWKMEFLTSLDSGVEPVAIEPAPLVHAVAVTQPAIAPTAAAASTPSVDNNSSAAELGTRIAALESAINNLSAAVAGANNQSGDEPVIADPDFGQQIEYESAFADSGEQSDEGFLQTEKTPEQENDAVPASVSIQEPFEQSMDDQFLTEPSLAEPPLTEQSLAGQGEPQFSISPNIKWQDQQRAQEANQLVAQGQINNAIEILQNYIATAEQPRESVKTLLDIFAVQENISAIQTLLAQANYLSVDEQSFYNAKIAVIQQKDAQAIQLLEANLGKAEHNENYRALLAGLYQRTGMNLEAANHYRRLLSVFGEKPAYWLGFALSQDALNQSKVAAQAYQRVNQYADLQPQVRTYVQQRIAALQE